VYTSNLLLVNLLSCAIIIQSCFKIFSSPTTKKKKTVQSYLQSVLSQSLHQLQPPLV
jgi:hypothetical protein